MDFISTGMGFLFRDFILKLLLFVDQFLDQCITTFEFDGHGFESLYDIIYPKNSRIHLSVIEIQVHRKLLNYPVRYPLHIMNKDGFPENLLTSLMEGPNIP